MRPGKAPARANCRRARIGLPVRGWQAVLTSRLKQNPSVSGFRWPAWAPVVGLLAAVLCVLFFRSFLPGVVHFANDGPLGSLLMASHRLPDMFAGAWNDLNAVGFREGTATPSFTYALLWALGPFGYAKFHPPLAILLLGVCAWFFFRRLGLAPGACVLGGLAAALNSTFFSVACWGISPHAIALAMAFLAMGLLVSSEASGGWLRTALAGMAVGMGVMEGADVGALLSFLVAGFAVFHAVAFPAGSPGLKRLAKGVGRVVVLAGFALFLASVAVVSLVETSIRGVAGTQQDTRTRAERWDFATQWSLPKVETLQLVVPGLFGFRMDTPEGGNYWGAVGRDPAWDRYFASGGEGPPPEGFMRFTGGGCYAGMLVVLLATWTLAQAGRKEGSIFSRPHRVWIAFWAVVAGVSLLLAWGRFAPFYQFLYALPYFSTIRNPAKFLSFVSFGLVVLFAFGVHGLARRYLDAAQAPFGRAGSWWKRLSEADRRWAVGALAALGLAVVAFLIYTGSRQQLIAHLNQVQIEGDIAGKVADFSFRQAGLAVVVLAGAVGLMLAVLSGQFARSRGLAAMIVLGAFLVVDLGRANLPWVVHWNWPYKYATNPVLDFLREKPHEQRVAGLPFPPPPQFAMLGDLYRIEWAQHHFLAQNIQSLDLVQMPRMPEDLAAFEAAWRTNGTPGLLRRWELTNTRYLLGPAGFAQGMNEQIDKDKRRFSARLVFDIQAKPDARRVAKLEDFTAMLNPQGPYAVIEFAGALPRAKLHSRWSVNTNSGAVLARILDPAFDPQQEVIISDAIAPCAPDAGTNAAGAVEFVSYAPKDIVLKASVQAPAVLLLNDRFDPNWRVLVDGQPAPLLRANFLMRGVRLEPGEHSVSFQFRVSRKPLYVSLAALAVGVLLVGVLVAGARGRGAASAPAAPLPPSPDADQDRAGELRKAKAATRKKSGDRNQRRPGS